MMSQPPTHEASLSALLARLQQETDRYEAQVDGGDSSVRRPAVRCQRMGLAPAGQGAQCLPT